MRLGSGRPGSPGIETSVGFQKINCCILFFYLPSNAAIWLPGDVSRLCELLAKVVARQFLEEEIVEALLRYETLNGYDASIVQKCLIIALLINQFNLKKECVL